MKTNESIYIHVFTLLINRYMSLLLYYYIIFIWCRLKKYYFGVQLEVSPVVELKKPNKHRHKIS